MIKGVNKQVLEINETKNGFFEKAIFFVKPEYSGMSEGKLREFAKKEIEAAGLPPRQKHFYKKTFTVTAICFAAGVILGLLLSNAF